MAKTKKTRQRRGYFWRVGRGWHVTSGKSKILLHDEIGRPLKTKDTPKATIVAAIARLRQEAVRIESGGFTMKELVDAFLLEAGPKLKPNTYKTRADFLHDFISGFPGSTRFHKQQPEAHLRLHRGFASVVASELTRDHIKMWLKAHDPDWSESGGQLIGKASVLRVLNWAVEEGKIKENPIKGIGLGQARSRLTYLTEKQEQAMLENALPDFADVLRILIRTGARYGCEFSMLRHRHVTFEERGMVWTFQAHENKTGSRTGEVRLYISDPEVIRLTKEAMERNDGLIFRNRHGRPWNPNAIRMAFTRLLIKVQATGIEFDEDICPYTLRHTFAKRTLSGHWHGGKPTTIEHLAALMGNTAEVCRKYAAWCPAYTDPIWASA